MVINNELIKTICGEDKDYALWTLFGNARYLAYRAREKELQRYNITPEQAECISIIYALRRKATLADIAGFTFCQEHTASAIIERMENKGLVAKLKNRRNHNQISIALTWKGEEVYKMITKRGPIHRIMNSISIQESEVLRKVLEKISVKAYEELGLNREPFPPSE